MVKLWARASLGGPGRRLVEAYTPFLRWKKCLSSLRGDFERRLL